MRALPAPAPPRTRQTAVQRADLQPSDRVLRNRGVASPTSTQREYAALLRDWQPLGSALADLDPSIRWATSVVPDTISRLIPQVQERVANGEWEPCEDPRLVDILERYNNKLEDSTGLIHSHAHHYQVEGELIQTVRDGDRGMEWGVWSRSAVEVNRPTQDDITVKLLPGGKTDDDTAFVVPKRQANHIWWPHRVWKGLPTSPLVAAIGATITRRGLDRYLGTTADSNARLNGVLWAADDHWLEPTPAHEQDPESNDVTVAQQTVEDSYYQLARMRWSDSEDITAVAPPFWHWPKEDGAPQWIQMGHPFDPQLAALREELLKEIGRALLVPLDWLLGGGPNTDANHWTGWQMEESYFEQAVAGYANRIFHVDLTRTFLQPLLIGESYDPTRYRLGYDASPVVVGQDKSAQAREAWMAALIGAAAAREAGGWTESDAPTPEDIELLELVLSRGQMGSAPGVAPPAQPGMPGAGPATVVKAPPEAPAAEEIPVPNPLPAPAVAAAYIGAIDGKPTPARARQVARQVTRRRSTTGAQILKATEMAYEEALNRAGIKVAARVQNRGTSTTVKNAALAAVGTQGPYDPALLGALGITEAALLAGAFVTLSATVKRLAQQWRERDLKLMENAGFDTEEFAYDDESTDAAAAFVVATALAAARQAILRGVDSSRIEDGVGKTPGQVTGGIPASLARDALRIAEGKAKVTFAEVADDFPTVSTLPSVRSIEQNLASYLAEEGEPQYVWVHGFYGDPHAPFEPHEDLGASEFTTADITHDPDLAVHAPYDWIDSDYYQPGDHAGCTCEWVPSFA